MSFLSLWEITICVMTLRLALREDNRFGGKSDRGRHNYNVENLIFVIYPAVPFTMRLNLKAALRFRSQGTKDSAHQVLFPGNGI